jgi:hypothetical protein
MGEWQLEMARRAVALLREALAGEGLASSSRIVKIITDSDSARDCATAGLAVHLLLGRCVDPHDLEHQLDNLERFLMDWLTAVHRGRRRNVRLLHVDA